MTLFPKGTLASLASTRICAEKIVTRVHNQTILPSDQLLHPTPSTTPTNPQKQKANTMATDNYISSYTVDERIRRSVMAAQEAPYWEANRLPRLMTRYTTIPFQNGDLNRARIRWHRHAAHNPKEFQSVIASSCHRRQVANNIPRVVIGYKNVSFRIVSYVIGPRHYSQLHESRT